MINFNYQYNIKTFFIKLKKNKIYNFLVDDNLKFIISKKDQKIISKLNFLEFVTIYNGHYKIDIFSIKDNINASILIKEKI